MNPTTQQVIEFLTRPELPFGAEEDVLLLSDPDALREQVATWLEENPTILGQQESANLKSHLAEADWPAVAQEFQARLSLAQGFFEADTPNTKE